MKTGITFIAFEFLHAGYIQMLAEAKNQCDYLIVGLNTNPNREQLYPLDRTYTLIERYIQLSGCKYVDEIIPYQNEEDLEDILRAFDIQVRILGEEYKNKDFTAKDYCIDKNIELYYNRQDLSPKMIKRV